MKLNSYTHLLKFTHTPLHSDLTSKYFLLCKSSNHSNSYSCVFVCLCVCTHVQVKQMIRNTNLQSIFYTFPSDPYFYHHYSCICEIFTLLSRTEVACLALGTRSRHHVQGRLQSLVLGRLILGTYINQVQVLMLELCGLS